MRTRRSSRRCRRWPGAANSTFPVIGVAKSGWTREQLVDRAKKSVTQYGGLQKEASTKLAEQIHHVDGDYGGARHALPKLKQQLERRVLAGKHTSPRDPAEHVPAGVGALFAVRQRDECTRYRPITPSVCRPASARSLHETLHKVVHLTGSDLPHRSPSTAKRRCRTYSLLPRQRVPSSRWNWHYEGRERSTIQRLAEGFGVAGRGKFYEETGVIRDVIQNHLLEDRRLSGDADPPSSTIPEAIRDEQMKGAPQRAPAQRRQHGAQVSFAATG